MKHAAQAIFLAGLLCVSAVLVPVHEDRVFEYSHWNPELIRQMNAGPRFLPADFPVAIPPPPAFDSKQAANELAYLEDLEKNRTPEQIKAIKDENTGFPDLFLTKLGIDPSTKPQTMELVRLTIGEVGYFILRQKFIWERIRPYELNSALTTVVDPPGHPSYPSGHAGQSRATALLLAVLSEEHASFWYSYADSVGKDREIAGVHYPSDTAAGIALADQVMYGLMKNPSYRAMVDSVKLAEWGKP